MSIQARLKGILPSSQVSNYLTGTISTPSAKGQFLVGGFLQELGKNGFACSAWSISVDSSYIYFSGFAGSQAIISKMNIDTGTSYWSKEDSVITTNAAGHTLNDSGELYFVGTSNYLGTTGIQIHRLASADGTKSWAKHFDNGTSTFVSGADQDSTHLWVFGYSGSHGGSKPYIPRLLKIAKSNGAYTQGWNLDKSSPNAASLYSNDISYDTTNAVPYMAWTDASNGIGGVTKIVAGSPISRSISTMYNQNTKIRYKNNNVYFSTTHQSGPIGVYDMAVHKLDSSFTHVWSRAIGSVSGYEEGGYGGILVDSSDNVYCIGYGPDLDNVATDSADVIITKFNSSGTLQWQRSLDISNYDLSYDCALSSDESFIYVTFQGFGTGGGTAGAFILKIPTNGGGTGTYSLVRVQGGSTVTFIYRESTYTVQSFTPTVSTVTVLLTGDSMATQANNEGLTSPGWTFGTRSAF